LEIVDRVYHVLCERVGQGRLHDVPSKDLWLKLVENVSRREIEAKIQNNNTREIVKYIDAWGCEVLLGKQGNQGNLIRDEMLRLYVLGAAHALVMSNHFGYFRQRHYFVKRLDWKTLNMFQSRVVERISKAPVTESRLTMLYYFEKLLPFFLKFYHSFDEFMRKGFVALAFVIESVFSCEGAIKVIRCYGKDTPVTRICHIMVNTAIAKQIKDQHTHSETEEDQTDDHQAKRPRLSFTQQPTIHTDESTA
jgi:hypothetical protein